ncbi:flavin reductase family protein [Virgibacillus sp. W0430]|uniref:flavin reductase family protein n=1 Tax=Virgibacillus sp. W0430 TaxID=3391580 RepID=UPI003F4735CB
MNNRLFRDAMGKFATGITIVTMDDKGEAIGMTVNAFMSVSLDPKLIAVSIDHKASMYNKLQETKKFGVSILTEHQKDISMIFAKQIEKDKEIAYNQLNQIPVIKDAMVNLACKVTNCIEAGDHMIFIAEVTDLIMNENKQMPVLYFNGQYNYLQSN